MSASNTWIQNPEFKFVKGAGGLTFWNTIFAASVLSFEDDDRRATRTALNAWASLRRVAISCAAGHDIFNSITERNE